jgi:hypothetical protein
MFKIITKYVSIMTTNMTTNMTTKNNIKKKSWAEMAYEADEEERIEKEEFEREKFKKILEKRRYLFSIGHYKLEEGEILE